MSGSSDSTVPEALAPLMERPVVAPAPDDLPGRSVDVIRMLAMDSVEKAGNGHPGTAMSLAPAAYTLFQDLLRHDPIDPTWAGRDRFVLSIGHSSLTLYIQLYLSGTGLALDDLKALRQWGSLTPGHPEHGHTAGVETTTGPLGQGIATAVGMAAGARKERGLFDPDAPVGESPFDHTIWVFASDGDLEEGVSGEACSWAGHQRLGNLVVLYDDNHISIEGNTDVAFSEDVLQRYEAYGWHVHRVPDSEDRAALEKALAEARDVTDRPSIVAVTSVIAWPAPDARNTGKSHGSALGADEIAATKQLMGLDPTKTFDVPDDVLAHTRGGRQSRGKELHEQWQQAFDAWRTREPERATLYDRLHAGALPDGWDSALPTWKEGDAVATRTASGAVLSALKDVLPELWGGSADLAGSTDTTMKGADSFLPLESGAPDANPYGRTLHFGIREHGMGAICNGIALHGPTRPYGATFFCFSDYMRGAVRIGALQKAGVVWVWTHDSIGLGEDGPTHQPIEHLASLRAMPNLAIVRPGDANETAAAWRRILTHRDGPVGLILTRQKVPVVAGTSAEGVARGGYIVAEASAGLPKVILIGTGSELQLALAARDALEAEGTPTRVVSLPCWEWFAEQDLAYRQQVLPSEVKVRVSVEAGSTFGWSALVGDHGASIGIDHYGASAPYETLYEQFGITSERVAIAARECFARLS